VYELNEVSFFNNYIPGVMGNVYQSTQKLKHKISVLTTRLNHKGIFFQVSDKVFMAVWIELGNVPDAFEQKSISIFAGSCY
jgi:hypothetical protein